MRDAVTRARAVAGTRFRPQGRDRRYGLDCVGLVLIAYELPAAAAPCDYALRGTSRRTIEPLLSKWFRRLPRTQVRDGDLLLLAPGADVLHLAISSGGGIIHPDVRHGVVERPAPLPWPLLAVFRRRVRIRVGD